ncbi:MAG: hypothetical protein Q8M78_09315, partial [Burkholderiaceae bacterium]|nr:hypothetical protein [Burkholderiaceae bacterium]
MSTRATVADDRTRDKAKVHTSTGAGNAAAEPFDNNASDQEALCEFHGVSMPHMPTGMLQSIFFSS